MEKMKMCRGCLVEGELMLSLFEVYEHDLSLADILQSCLATEVFENDNLPPFLCDKCIQTLTQFYNFSIIYEQSDNYLHSLFKKSIKKEILTDTEEHQSENENAQTDKSQSHFQQRYTISNKNLPEDCNSELDHHMEELQENVNYITLNNIKAENIDLEVFQAQNTTNIAIVKSEIPKPSRIIVTENDEVYEEIEKYVCTSCGEEHLYITAFRNHMRLKHEISLVNPAEYVSTVRLKVPKAEPNLDELTQAHEEIMCSEPLLKCNICEKKFHFATQLSKHVKLHTIGKKFICEVCGAAFIRKTYLEDHKEGHSTERKHACPYCNKRFRRRTVLRAHKRSHTHRNHYVCELCGRAFTGKGTLRTHHLLIHVRERNFECMICHQKFPLKSTLNKHVLRHEKREKGEKGFRCTECEMEYRDKSSLKRHVEVKHLGNVVLVQCPDCPKEYTSNANLQKHRKRHHPTEIDALI